MWLRYFWSPQNQSGYPPPCLWMTLTTSSHSSCWAQVLFKSPLNFQLPLPDWSSRKTGSFLWIKRFKHFPFRLGSAGVDSQQTPQLSEFCKSSFWSYIQSFNFFFFFDLWTVESGWILVQGPLPLLSAKSSSIHSHTIPPAKGSLPRKIECMNGFENKGHLTSHLASWQPGLLATPS